jgi:hypothetical protein
MTVMLDSFHTSALETKELDVVEDMISTVSNRTLTQSERRISVAIPPEMKATTPRNPSQREVIGQWLFKGLAIVRGLMSGTAYRLKVDNSTQTDVVAKTNFSDPQFTAWSLRQDENFSLVISRVISLLQDKDETRPTDYALKTVLEILFEAQRLVNRNYGFPRASVSSDDEGAINVHWRTPTRKVQLGIPSAEQGRLFIYHREGDKYNFEYNVSGQSLANWLNWFSAA